MGEFCKYIEWIYFLLELMQLFTTDIDKIREQVSNVDPVAYGKSRNYLDGAVTRLSPYISRGVISTRQIAKSVIARGFKFYQIESFLKELAWRDYFQQVWISKGDELDTDLKRKQEWVSHFSISKNIVLAQTEIEAVDNGIRELYSSGYMHNHMRMYVASLSCNIAQNHWQQPARWMYYHLLDADWGSNALSWQWVAGSFSAKKYIANQKNINKYFYTNQQNTYLDIAYEDFDKIGIPEVLQEPISLKLETKLPESGLFDIDENLPIYLYNFYNLDSEWDNHVQANRILLLEPSHFKKYPVSEKTIAFIIELSKNIKGIKLIVGDFNNVFSEKHFSLIRYKEHPTSHQYKGTAYDRDWMFEEVNGYYPSFFAYWKKCEKHLSKLM
jgi:deoxyribodipyrimidine photo-lyase